MNSCSSERELNKNERQPPGYAIFLILFTVSGFTGLIYESLWTHYLKLFLGHAAYAQTLVLAIFMGGLTAGSWICSRYSQRWSNLLKGYALAEGTIGLLAIIFHPVFVQTVDFSYVFIIPSLKTPLIINWFKWIVSALLILPQTVLLGMTFPLMSAALLRRFPDTPGRSIALLYFTNSIGASIGVLMSGFVLIRLMGLPGTIILAGTMNIALAIIVWRLAADSIESTPESQSAAKDITSTTTPIPYRLLLFISLATGTASFIYEIGWIRMLSLVLGSSTHAFELMLSAFIAGLAFGGLWIQRRIDRTADPVRFLALVQIVMGLMAVATLPVYGQSFGVMKWLISSLPKTDSGYLLFNLSSNAIALVIMLPATLCAGMTLPLITYALIKSGQGERSIGAVYAMNTVGAIIGVFFAVHVGMPMLGLKGLITAGAALDMSLGLILLVRFALARQGVRPVILAVAVCACAISSIVFLVRIDPHKMISGVYRHGKLLDPGENKLVFHKDGKTATVSVDVRRSGLMSIRTNGKTDAGINVLQGNVASGEESTMVLVAAIPMAYHPQAQTVANIGLGSGLTTHTLLSNPLLKKVDTIEIEKEIIEAAKSFGHRVEHVYQDPRSVIYVDDAKTFFSSHKNKYDIIISEPSNPWVSGVAGLYSEEFYHSIPRYLNDNGIFVQWLQMYEIDDFLVASVMKALSQSFSDYVVYAVDSFDVIILARRTGTFPKPDASILAVPEIMEAMKQVNIRNIQDLDARKIGDRKMLSTLFDMSPIRANSDFYPVLDQNAAQTRFLGSAATNMMMLSIERFPLAEMLGASRNGDIDAQPTRVTFSPNHGRTWRVTMAMTLRDFFIHGNFVSYGRSLNARMKEDAIRLKQMYSNVSDPNDPNRRNYLFHTAEYMMPYLHPDECTQIWKVLESGPGAASLSAMERQYVELLKAIGNRDARGMAFTARTILETEQDITRGRMKYVLAAGMLGNIALEKPEEASQLWVKYRSMVFQDRQPDILFRFLEAKSLKRNP